MSSSDRPSSPWPRSKVGPPRPEQPAAAKCATRLSLRTSRPPASTPRHSSLAVTHLLTPTFLSVRRCRGSIFRFKAHEKRGISSSIGIQVWFFVSRILLSNSPLTLTLPACAAAQVGVDFLDGEEWALSTSNSRADFGIFDMLFDLIELGTLRVRCAARAHLPSLSVPPPCCYAPPQCSPASDSRPSTDSAWQDFCAEACSTAPSTSRMAADVRAALRRAAAARWQLRSDSFLFALRLERREGGRSKGRQGALCARLAQEPPRCRRWSVPRRAGGPGPKPRSASARVSYSCVCRVSCEHVSSVCTGDRSVYVNSARRFAGNAGEPAASVCVPISLLITVEKMAFEHLCGGSASSESGCRQCTHISPA